MRKYLKFVFYGCLAIEISCFAGSFEDFFAAIRNDNARSLINLLQRGFDPNTRDEKGQPGLVLAMQQRSSKAAAALLSHPLIEVDALNQAGESALMIAALKGEVDAAKLLLSRGAKVNQPGWSALHYAASGEDAQLVRLLVEQDADANAASPNGSTPLMMAAQYGSEEGAKLLLGAGADPKRRNQRGLAASDFARMAGREALATALARLER
jgi:uncharacterized protein